MLKCAECKEIFSESEIQYVDESFYVPYGDQMVKKEEYSAHCPHCGSADFDEFYEESDEDEC